MTNEQSLDNLVKSKDTIRKAIRGCLNYKSNSFREVEIKEPIFEAPQDLYRDFITEFRAAGGLYFPCNNTPGDNNNLIRMMTKILKSSNYTSILNTCPPLEPFLAKHQIRHSNVINVNEPAEVAIVYSDMLIARDGSVGFHQTNTLYPSIRNLAQDILVVSFKPCIHADRIEAMKAYRLKNNNLNPPMTEFIIPTKLETINKKAICSPSEPRFFLLMVEQDIFANRPAVPQTDVQHESKDQEPID